MFSGTQFSIFEPDDVINAPCTPDNSSTCSWVKGHSQQVIYSLLTLSVSIIVRYCLEGLNDSTLIHPVGPRPCVFALSSG